MSDSGQKRTLHRIKVMPALPREQILGLLSIDIELPVYEFTP
jgi:hypothetical protein